MRDMDINRQSIWEQSGFKLLELNFNNGATVIDNEEIVSESMKLVETLCDEQNIVYGKCSSKQFNVRIMASTISFIGARLKPTLTINPDTEKSDTINLGSFVVYSENKTSDKMYKDIVAYDDLYTIANTDVSAWYNSLTFPMTLKQFRDKFFQHFNVTQEDVSLPMDNLTIEKTIEPSVLSGLVVIEAICEVNGCFGQINYDGKMTYIYIRSKDDALYPEDNLYPSDKLFPIGGFDYIFTLDDYIQNGLKYEDYSVKPITAVVVRASEDDVGAVYSPNGDTSNTYSITNNFLLYGASQETLMAVAKNMYNQNYDVYFVPGELKTWCKPWLELGDIISVTTRKGDVVMFPILCRSISGITSLYDEYSAKSEETFNSEINSLNSSIEQLKGKSNILVRTIDETRSTLEDADKKIKSEIKQTAESIELSVDNELGSAKITLSITDATSGETTKTESSVEITSNTIKLSASEVIELMSGGTLTLGGEKGVIIDGSNFSVDKDGNAEFKGSIESGSTITTPYFEVNGDGVVFSNGKSESEYKEYFSVNDNGASFSGAISTPYFTVDSNGASFTGSIESGSSISTPYFTANSNGAEINGKVTATSGEIGGCSIVDGNLQVDSAHITSINADTINSGNINCNLLKGGTITGQTIDGGTISGATIKADTSITIGNGEDGKGKGLYFENANLRLGVTTTDTRSCTYGGAIQITPNFIFMGGLTSYFYISSNCITPNVTPQIGMTATGSSTSWYINTEEAVLPYTKVRCLDDWGYRYSICTNNTDGQRVSRIYTYSSQNRIYFIKHCLAVDPSTGASSYYYDTFYTTVNASSSDIRLKENVSDSNVNALSLINSIKVRAFDWKDHNKGHQKIGFIADELEKLDCMLSNGGGFFDDGSINIKDVNTFYLQGYEVKAIQELSAEVDNLKETISKQQEEIEELKKLVKELVNKE